MSGHRRALGAGIVAAMLIGLLHRSTGRFNAHNSDQVGTKASPSVLPVNGAAEASIPPGPATRPLRGEDPRTPLASPALAGFVRSASGAPLAGAEVRWIALERQDVEIEVAWRALDWGWIERDSVLARTDDQGRFALDHYPAAKLPKGSILTAQESQHVGKATFLPAEEEEWPRALEFVLPDGERQSVRVVDAAGRAWPGARVLHQALASTESPWSRFLFETLECDAHGHAWLTPFPGEHVVWAESKNSVSVPWSGLPAGEVVLTLGESFTLGGHVTYPQWDTGYIGERRLLVSGLTGNLWRPLVQLRSVQAGTFGPVQVPCEGVDRIRVRLEGSPIIPEMREFSCPQPGSRRELVFSCRKGAALWFEAFDEEGHPVRDARAAVRWEDLDAPGGQNQVESGAKPNGRIDLYSFPPGRVRYRVFAPGYAPYENDQLVPIDYAMAITLHRAALLRGRCVSGGRSVPDFELRYWRAGGYIEPVSQSYFGRSNGDFELELAAGDWLLAASSANSPGCLPASVTLSEEDEQTVTLELPEALVGYGRVVDAADGRALADARLQPLSPGTEPPAPWGPECSVNSDGSFLISGFSLGRNQLWVKADGFALRKVEAFASAGQILDWGEIRLFRPQPLRIQLTGFEGSGSNALDFEGRAVGLSPLPTRRFGADGWLEYEGVAPGYYQFDAVGPDGRWTRRVLDLQPGQNWTYELPVGGEEKLVVYLKQPRGTTLEYTPGVMVTNRDLSGAMMVRMRVATDDHASFEGLRSDEADISVIDGDTREIARSHVALTPGEITEVAIELGSEPLIVRVVDGSGQPVAGALARARSASAQGFFGRDQTDAQGLARLHGVPGEGVLLDVIHPVAGQRFGVPVDTSASLVSVTLEASGSLHLSLRDGDLTLTDVSTTLVDGAGIALTAARTSDGRGEVEYASLGAGHYRLAFARTDCWPATLETDLRQGEEIRRTVQLRRLADLTVKLTAGGLPVAGQRLNLRSEEFEADVADWVARSEGLVSGPDGRIEVERLPHGAYAWSLVTVDGRAFSGRVDLAVDRPNELGIALD